MATNSSIFAWRIPWTEEPGGTVHGVANSQTRLSIHALKVQHTTSEFQRYLASVHCGFSERDLGSVGFDNKLIIWV